MIETRQHINTQLEVRQSGEEPAKLTGYAIVWNTLSAPLLKDGLAFRERILPGAFAKDIAGGRDVRALVDHDRGKVLGRMGAGTLSLSSDEHGLRFEIVPPATSYANDIVESVRRGDVTGMSFGFGDARATYQFEGGERIRSITQASLGEISIVSFPAYDSGLVTLRELPSDTLAELSRLNTPHRLNAARKQLMRAQMA